MSKNFYQAIHKAFEDLAPHFSGRFRFDDDGRTLQYWGRSISPIDTAEGLMFCLVMLIEAVEMRELNWEISRQGRNPDGTWQYWAKLSNPTKPYPPVTCKGAHPVEALAYALRETTLGKVVT